MIPIVQSDKTPGKPYKIHPTYPSVEYLTIVIGRAHCGSFLRFHTNVANLGEGMERIGRFTSLKQGQRGTRLLRRRGWAAPPRRGFLPSPCRLVAPTLAPLAA